MNIIDLLTFFKEHPFYIVHSVRTMELLTDVLNDGIIKLGTDVVGKKDVLFGDPAVYGNIFFEDLKNLNAPMRVNILISPLVLLDCNNIKIDKGWGIENITEINAKTENVIDELTKVYEFIKHPDLKEKMLELTKSITIMRHQLVLSNAIDLNKHILGVVCNCDEKQFELIRNLLSKYKNRYVGTNFPIIFSPYLN